MGRSEWLEMAALVAALAVMVVLSSCRGSVPKGNWEIWAGSSEYGGIERRQTGQAIKASDPRFDDFLAIHRVVFLREYERLVNGCEKWRPGVSMISSHQAWGEFREAMK